MGPFKAETAQEVASGAGTTKEKGIVPINALSNHDSIVADFCCPPQNFPNTAAFEK